jgi:hypothetical protein
MLGTFQNLNFSGGLLFVQAALTVSFGRNNAGAIVGVITFTGGESALPISWAVSSYDTTTFPIGAKLKQSP